MSEGAGQILHPAPNVLLSLGLEKEELGRALGAIQLLAERGFANARDGLLQCLNGATLAIMAAAPQGRVLVARRIVGFRTGMQSCHDSAGSHSQQANKIAEKQD